MVGAHFLTGGGSPAVAEANPGEHQELAPDERNASVTRKEAGARI